MKKWSIPKSHVITLCGSGNGWRDLRAPHSQQAALPPSGNHVHRPTFYLAFTLCVPDFGSSRRQVIGLVFELGPVHAPGSSCMRYVRGMKGLSHPGDKAATGFVDSIFLNAHPLSLACKQKEWFAGSFTQPQAQCAIRSPLGGHEVEWDALRPAHSGLQIGLVLRETGHGVSSRIFIYPLSRYLVPTIFSYSCRL